MKYFLTGYMASGKTRRGRLMAEELGIRFIDLDAYIVRREGRSIAGIFRDGGEETFRRLERRYLHEICELYGDFVLSTGGGTPCFYDNMSYMNSMGHTIFLNTAVEVIVGRLMRSRQRRPLLSGLKDEEVSERVREHLQQRMPYYLLAKEIIE